MTVEANRISPAYADRRACPICSTWRLRHIFTGDRFSMGLRTDICLECCHIFTNPPPTQAWLSDFYRNDYRTLYNSAPTPDDHLLASHNPAEIGLSANALALTSDVAAGRLIDIGCAEGQFLGEVAKLRPDWELWGIEPNPEYADYARKRLSGSTIIAGDFQSAIAGVPKGTFSHVSLLHVLEHALEPQRFLEHVATLLAPDGILMVEVPVGDRRRPVNYFHIAHVHHFSRESLEMVIMRAGFRIENVAINPHRGSPTDGSYTVIARGVGAPIPTARLRSTRAREIVRGFRILRMKHVVKRLLNRI